MSVTHGVVQTSTTVENSHLRLRGSDSDGHLGLVEIVMRAGNGGPPLHVHPTHGEGFYVLDGQVTFQLGDEVITGGPGTWVFAPKDTPHTLANLSGQDARLLCTFSPAGFERRFECQITEQAGSEPLAELSPAERETRAVGPPLSARSE